MTGSIILSRLEDAVIFARTQLPPVIALVAALRSFAFERREARGDEGMVAGEPAVRLFELAAAVGVAFRHEDEPFFRRRQIVAFHLAPRVEWDEHGGRRRFFCGYLLRLSRVYDESFVEAGQHAAVDAAYARGERYAFFVNFFFEAFFVAFVKFHGASPSSSAPRT